MYPRTVVLKDDKLKKLIIEKGQIIDEGRKISEEIDQLEKEMDALNEQMVEIESQVDVTPLMLRAKELSEKLKPLLQEMEDIKNQRDKAKADAVPQELVKEYETKKGWKETLETERNKKALKAQKWKDKIIRIGQMLSKRHLRDEFEDYDTIQIENDEAVIKIFSHLEDFKKNFRKKNNK